MHYLSETTPYRGLRKVADDIGQLDDMKLTPHIAMAEKPPCKPKLCILRLHRLVQEWKVFADNDVSRINYEPFRSWVSKAEYQLDLTGDKRPFTQ